MEPIDGIFYMNFTQGGNTPAYQFTKLEDAEKEAARLASELKRPVFTLMAVVKTEPKHDVIRTELKPAGLPEKTE